MRIEKYHLQTGEQLPYLDQTLTLHVYREDRKSCKISAVRDKKSRQLLLLMFVPLAADYEVKRAALGKWYRMQSRNSFVHFAEQYAKQLGVTYEEIRIKDQRSRWGSCSSKRNLNFNWRLVLAPEKVLIYVVVHELCHLRHMDHSKEFWALVEKTYPGYAECKKWLKEHGAELYKI